MQIDREQIETLLGDQSDGPVAMINLLCFKDRAEGVDLAALVDRMEWSH